MSPWSCIDCTRNHCAVLNIHLQLILCKCTAPFHWWGSGLQDSVTLWSNMVVALYSGFGVSGPVAHSGDQSIGSTELMWIPMSISMWALQFPSVITWVQGAVRTRNPKTSVYVPMTLCDNWDCCNNERLYAVLSTMVFWCQLQIRFVTD